MEVLGIDIGGTGIKVARVDVRTGKLTTELIRYPTPDPSTPKKVLLVVRKAIREFAYEGAVGCGFPGVVRNGVIQTAANVSKKWIDVRADELYREATGLPFFLANDADLAGVAEMRFGAGRGRKGLVIMLTFGTGIGTGVFMDGKLVPNSELGHLEVRGHEAEKWASERTRIVKKLSFRDWAWRVNVYLNRLHAYFWPELFIIGGGVSREFEKFRKYLEVPCELLPATLRNRAGVIGAAYAASRKLRI
ncbi:MAG TPA: ROK family protein [Acidimicrobiia bacterium]|nr:ROK family protein [Acidimicrobiia bacterium]